MRGILAGEGYRAISFERLALETGVSTESLMARYPSVAELVFACLVNDEPLPAPPDMGSLAADIHLLTEQLVHRMDNRVARAALPFLLAEIAGDDELRPRFLIMFTSRHLPTFQVILQRALDRGEISCIPDLTEVHILITGPILSWVSLYRQQIDEQFIHRLASTFAAALPALASASDKQGLPLGVMP